jgi:hypothetical protein
MYYKEIHLPTTISRTSKFVGHAKLMKRCIIFKKGIGIAIEE